MKKTLLLITSCLLFTVFLAQAQPPPPPPPGPLSGTAAPIDNEVIFLLAAASLFGAYKIYRSQSINTPVI
ncbi:MAG: hypothetical protein POELPBGB_02455 [Bacteroidia bacterium]|nr:hypothetical protein [Bacteroidia bacterium]